MKFMGFHILFVTVVWNPWDKKAKAMSDFGDDEYKRMVCVEAAAIEKPVTLSLVRNGPESWNFLLCHLVITVVS